MSCAKTAVHIKMRFELLSRVGLGNHVLDGSAHWRHLTNTTEPSGRGARYCDQLVCPSVRSHISETTRPNFTKFSVHVTYDHFPYLLIVKNPDGDPDLF